MLIVENLPAIEKWLAKLPDEKRIGLNHPMVVWRGFLTAKKRRNDATCISEGAWQERQTMPEEIFAAVFNVIAENLETQDPMRIAMAVVRAQGLALPQSIIRAESYKQRRRRPPQAWSPFSLA
jgi:hypothetical protein